MTKKKTATKTAASELPKTQSLPQQDEIIVPLSLLDRSDYNIRKVDPDKKDDAELIASIKAHGLLQALSVHEDNGIYKVCAGGRRFYSLKHLQAQGVISDDYEVPCILVRAEDAVDISVAENLHATLHPADEFKAYQKMVFMGRTPKQIAEAFGKTLPQVKKLLKLGDVADEIVDHFRAGKMTLDTVMAFTLTDDKEEQLLVFKQLKTRLGSYSVRNALTKGAIDSNDRIAKFVGVQAYKKAGGKTQSDLFQSVTYFLDESLLNKLATEKMEQVAEKKRAEGWAWVECTLSRESQYSHSQIDAEPQNVPADLNERMENIQQKMTEIENTDWESISEEKAIALDEELDQLNDELETVQTELEQYRVFTDDQKKISGVIIYINYNGKLIVESGMMTHTDYRAYQAGKFQSASDNAGDPPQYSQQPPAMESAPLIDSIGESFCLAIQETLASNPAFCMDLLIVTLADQMLGESPAYGSEVLTVRAEEKTYQTDPAQEESEKYAVESMKKLDMSWRTDSPSETLGNFMMLSQDIKMAWAAQAVSCFVNVNLRTAKQDSYLLELMRAMNFNIRHHWKPTADNYFSRLKKPQLLTIGEDIEPGFAEKWKSAKKATLVTEVERIATDAYWMPDLITNAFSQVTADE